MEERTTDICLQYKFTTEEIITQGRTSKENLEEIRSLLSNFDNKYVPKKLQDEILVIFLICCENDIQLTYNSIVSHYYLKGQKTDLYDDRNMNRADIQLALRTIRMLIIPVRTELNEVIHFFNLRDTDYRNCFFAPSLKVALMLVDLSQESNPPDGIIVVMDLKGSGIKHMTCLKLDVLKNFLSFLQQGFPMKLKAVHVLNTVWFVDQILAIIKKFVKSEVMDLVKFHPPGLPEEELFKVIPKKCLPKEYGGDLPSQDTISEKVIEQLINRQSFWEEEEKLRKSQYLLY